MYIHIDISRHPYIYSPICMDLFKKKTQNPPRTPAIYLYYHIDIDLSIY